MIASTSGNSAPARMSFRMLRTDSLEKNPDSLRGAPIAGRSCARDCVADFILKNAGSVNRKPHGQPSGKTEKGSLFRVHRWVGNSSGTFLRPRSRNDELGERRSILE